jgi:hypothetical protein
MSIRHIMFHAPGRIHRWFAQLVVLAAAAASSTGLAAELPEFRAHAVTTSLKTGYQLVVADLNGDGRKDVIALDERATELAWFENPGWQRNVLAVDVPRPINADCWDVDGDGTPEVALAFRFETDPDKSIGNFVILKKGTDIRQPWIPKEIDRVPTAHRVRWIDPEGRGKKVLLLAPLVGPKAHAPSYDDDVPIFLYRPGSWQRETLSSQLHGILHAIVPVDWEGGARQQLLTAGFLGLHRFDFERGRWIATKISAGDPRGCPECGSSEVRLGHLGRNRFLAAIEPWHGNQVVVHLARKKEWDRVVLDDSMLNGHALAVGDLDGDGRDEIVSGFRGKGFRLSVFRATDRDGRKWSKTVLDDGGIAAADCKIEDMNGDGKPDIVCIGASTGNVKIYENLGRSR